MSDDDKKLLGDRLRKAVQEQQRFPLDGDVYNRVVRALSTLLQYDIEQLGGGTGQGPRLGLREDVGAEVLLVDASVAPFRTNGKGWSAPFNLAAGGAGNTNLLELANASDTDLLIIDGILTAGQAALRVSIASQASIIAGGTALTVVEAESPSTKIASTGITRPFTNLVTFQTLLSTVAFNGGSFFTVVPGAAGFFPVGAVLFPGEFLDVNQLVVNLAAQGAISGRVWKLGKSLNRMQGVS